MESDKSGVSAVKRLEKMINFGDSDAPTAPDTSLSGTIEGKGATFLKKYFFLFQYFQNNAKSIDSQLLLSGPQREIFSQTPHFVSR